MMLNSIDTEYEQIIMTDEAEQELFKFMTDWGYLSGRRDTEQLAQILPDDLIQTIHDGRILTKTEYLEDLKNFPADFTVNDYDRQAQIFDHTAIVRAAYELEMNGNIMRLRYTATFLKRAGKWQPVALHSSLLAGD